MQSVINKFDIISDDKPKDITQNQIITEKPEQENLIEQIDNLQILGEKTNKEESDKCKIITQNNSDINNEDIENEKLDKLLEKLKGNGLTVTYNSENKNWDIERPENVTEQIDEIEIAAKERPENIEESIDEVEIIPKQEKIKNKGEQNLK